MRIIAGARARPNFMKITTLMWEIECRTEIEAYLVHTGQHYDERMSKLFFEEIGIPRPTSTWVSERAAMPSRRPES